MKLQLALFGIFAVALLVGCAPSSPSVDVNNSTIQTAPLVVVPEITEPKTYNAAQTYAMFHTAVVVVETNCTYNFTYRDFELKWRQAVNAEPSIYVDERSSLRTHETSIDTSGTGYRRNDFIYTNNHVVDCDAASAENETKDALLSAYSGMRRGGYVDPDRFKDLTHLDVDAEAKTIFKYVKEENPDLYTEEDIRRWITWVLVKYLAEHTESIKLVALNESRVVRTNADEFTASYVATLKEHGKTFPEADYAILKVDDLPSDVTNIAEISTVTVGEDLFIVGYPASSLEENTTNGVLREPPVITKGIASSRRLTTKGVEYYAVDAASRGGSSGSPVLNVRGQLLGMLTAGYDDASLSFILSVKEIE